MKMSKIIIKKNDTADIILLKNSLNKHIENEEYEKASVVKRWIDEINEQYKNKSKK